jgi:hypothetical protein
MPSPRSHPHALLHSITTLSSSNHAAAAAAADDDEYILVGPQQGPHLHNLNPTGKNSAVLLRGSDLTVLLLQLLGQASSQLLITLSPVPDPHAADLSRALGVTQELDQVCEEAALQSHNKAGTPHDTPADFARALLPSPPPAPPTNGQ